MVKIQSCKKGFGPALSFFIGIMVLSGCGKETQFDTRLSLDKDGVVVSTIYESFDQDYYDVAELSDMATEEISYYNSEYISPRISLDETVKLENQPYVKLVMTFDSSVDYSHFNQELLFFGTVQEAVESGYELSAGLVDSDGQKIDLGSGDFLDRHIVISSEKVIIETPYNIEFMTSGVALRDKKEADLTNVLSDSVQLLLSK